MIRLVTLCSILVSAAPATAQDARPTALFGRPVAEWVGDLEGGNIVLRREATSALRSVGPAGQTAVKALTEALKDEDPDVRRQAAYALGGIGAASAEAVPALRLALDDREVGVRYAAAQALGKIGSPAKGAGRELNLTLSDENPLVQIRAAESLFQSDAENRQQTSDFLYDFAINDVNVEAARIEAVVTLARVDPERAKKVAPLLRQFWESQDSFVRVRMADASTRIEPDKANVWVPTLTNYFRDVNETERVRIEAARVLARIEPKTIKDTTPVLLRYLRTGSGIAQLTAAEALREIDPEAARQAGLP